MASAVVLTEEKVDEVKEEFEVVDDVMDDLFMSLSLMKLSWKAEGRCEEEEEEDAILPRLSRLALFLTTESPCDLQWKVIKIKWISKF